VAAYLPTYMTKRHLLSTASSPASARDVHPFSFTQNTYRIKLTRISNSIVVEVLNY